MSISLTIYPKYQNVLKYTQSNYAATYVTFDDAAVKYAASAESAVISFHVDNWMSTAWEASTGTTYGNAYSLIRRMVSSTDTVDRTADPYDSMNGKWYSPGTEYQYELKNIKAATLQYGLFIYTMVQSASGSSYMPITIDYITITIPDSVYYDFPSIASPTGAITKGGIYRLTWTVKDQDATEETVLLQYRASGETDATEVKCSAGTRYYDVDTSSVAGITGMEWRVGVTSSGVTNWTDWQANAFSKLSVSLTDLYPTGSVYRGFSQVYRWALSYSTPSDAVGTNISQASAELRYRAAGATAYSTIAISGSTTNYTMAGDVLPVGSVEWQVAVTTNCGYIYTSSWTTITNTELPITIDNLYPGASGHAVKSVVNRFGWTFTVDDTSAPVMGYARQASAILYWRASGSGDYTAISISGEAQYYDMPAGTFTIDAIDWYVKVTANTGTEATSSVVTVSTLDTLSTPACVSPSGTYVDDTSGATFAWEHINATGTAQTAWELSYSQDSGANYTVLASGTDAASTYKSAAKAFSIGTLYWHVRTKNQDGAWGSYATPAIVIIQRAPDAPTITYSDTLPLPTIKWQSDAHVGYEIEVDGVSLGMVYSAAKQWRSSALLPDGQHVIRLRIANVLEDVSPWTSITINTDNVPSGSATASAEAEWAQVHISYTLSGTFAAVCLLRDGELISKAAAASSGTFIDRETAGAHSYVVRAFTADGYYTDSSAVQAAPSIPSGAIGLADGTGWVLLRCTAGKDFISRSRSAASGAFLQYIGRDYPVYDGDSGEATETLTAEYILQSIDVSALTALIGKTVVYKDFRGNCIMGTFTVLPQSQHGSKHTTITLAITRVHREALTYDTV